MHSEWSCLQSHNSLYKKRIQCVCARCFATASAAFCSHWCHSSQYRVTVSWVFLHYHFLQTCPVPPLGHMSGTCEAGTLGPWTRSHCLNQGQENQRPQDLPHPTGSHRLWTHDVNRNPIRKFQSRRTTMSPELSLWLGSTQVWGHCYFICPSKHKGFQDPGPRKALFLLLTTRVTGFTAWPTSRTPWEPKENWPSQLSWEIALWIWHVHQLISLSLSGLVDWGFKVFP